MEDTQNMSTVSETSRWDDACGMKDGELKEWIHILHCIQIEG